MIEMLGLMLLVAIVAIPVGVHLGFRAPRVREQGSPADFGLAFEEVRIPTVRGRTLFGWLLPAPGAQGTLVLLHGWGSNAEHLLPLAAPLRRGGLNILLCDARNHGDSDGYTFISTARSYWSMARTTVSCRWRTRAASWPTVAPPGLACWRWRARAMIRWTGSIGTSQNCWIFWTGCVGVRRGFAVAGTCFGWQGDF